MLRRRSRSRLVRLSLKSVNRGSYTSARCRALAARGVNPYPDKLLANFTVMLRQIPLNTYQQPLFYLHQRGVSWLLLLLFTPLVPLDQRVVIALLLLK